MPKAAALLMSLVAFLPATVAAESFEVSAIVFGKGARLQMQAPTLMAPVADRAAQAVLCARASGQRVDRLIVVDMAQEATQERLWTFDLTRGAELMLHTRVAHGAGSDPNKDGVAERFSNRLGSGMTSLGLYRVSESYYGKHGLSRRLDGLMDGFNDAARARAVVLHPAPYVREDHVGRSLGCPAVSPEAMEALEEASLENTVLWIDGPDPKLELALAECTQQRNFAMVAR